MTSPAASVASPSPLPGVSVRDARLSYGDTLLFDGLALDLAPGRWTCLLGPSGVGKTTLLRLIAGLEQGADGQATCGDGLPAHGRVAYMAQQDLLLPWLTLRENLVLGSRLRGDRTRETEARADGLLQEIGLGDSGSLFPRACSGGMRQRAALARTLMDRRPIVLMDEPFSALDAITRLQLQDVAARLLADCTVLLVTHDPLEALRLGHDIVVMTGRPATLGAPIRPPASPPRPADDPTLIGEHARLLGELARAGEESARR